MKISEILKKQRDYFNSGATKSIAYRRKTLIRFRESIKNNEQSIIKALKDDFNKPVFESVATEIGIVEKELTLAIKNIWKWQQARKVGSSILNFPSRDYIFYEPYGTTLIIAPWNYPFQLAMGPLIGAIAAGNTVVIKPSELTPNTSAVIAKIVSDTFDPDHVTVVQGDKEVATSLLAERWDYIFFTGSITVGKIIYKAAAKHLTPVTLELGGKSPCVIDETAKIKQAARRIVWGKFVNAGQTCIAPDYILVHSSKKDILLKALGEEITRAFGDNPENSSDFARIINDRNFDRLSSMLTNVNIHIGGQLTKESRYISPTIVADVTLEDQIMKEEIFGPLLPVMTYNSKEDISDIIHSFEKPLSAYVFSRKRSFIKWFNASFSYGGGVMNDTLVHFINDNLPFGGVGHSGIGSYHGKESFYTFSHAKSIIKRGTWIDVPVRYAPYKGKLGLLKSFFRWF